MERQRTLLVSIAAILVAFTFAGCTTLPTHSPKDYASAMAAADPDGSLTTIVGPVTAVVKMKSTVKFPQGDTVSGVRTVLMYDRPNAQPGFCTFEIGHRILWSIVRENRVKRPCDGKHRARFRIAGTDIGFIAHLTRTNYKGTPVTLLEISDHHLPGSMQVVY
ncbi:MAG: hypothetical protein ABSF08_08985 [Candidatus Cybelea sp.]